MVSEGVAGLTFMECLVFYASAGIYINYCILLDLSGFSYTGVEIHPLGIKGPTALYFLPC